MKKEEIIKQFILDAAETFGVQSFDLVIGLDRESEKIEVFDGSFNFLGEAKI